MQMVIHAENEDGKCHALPEFLYFGPHVAQYSRMAAAILCLEMIPLPAGIHTQIIEFKIYT
jgi:hypothetical protein